MREQFGNFLHLEEFHLLVCSSILRTNYDSFKHGYNRI